MGLPVTAWSEDDSQRPMFNRGRTLIGGELTNLHHAQVLTAVVCLKERVAGVAFYKNTT